MIRRPPRSTRTDTLFPYTTLFRSIPGIDMVVAVGLLAAIGPIDRFTSPARLVAFLGLNPSVHQSGNSPARHGRFTKQGPCHARRSEERRVGKALVRPCISRWSTIL